MLFRSDFEKGIKIYTRTDLDQVVKEEKITPQERQMELGVEDVKEETETTPLNLDEMERKDLLEFIETNSIELEVEVDSLTDDELRDLITDYLQKDETPTEGEGQ